MSEQHVDRFDLQKAFILVKLGSSVDPALECILFWLKLMIPVIFIDLESFCESRGL